eukprot:TRINITY_DN2958_c0_g1_i1.p4 TRINITY_DN2958_c0_g1~~TRINITY_DN2958_c0_g1_i1.p4  ORF type:complete len:107 (+),score=1.12 TRINITY_DN2958_c0_g1_i1:129-449(+)
MWAKGVVATGKHRLRSAAARERCERGAHAEVTAATAPCGDCAQEVQGVRVLRARERNDGFRVRALSQFQGTLCPSRRTFPQKSILTALCGLQWCRRNSLMKVSALS